MLEKVIENWTSRLDYIRASRGSHMPETIFKIKSNPTQRSCANLNALDIYTLKANMDLEDSKLHSELFKSTDDDEK
ncbi:hypothetical protein TNCV_4982451 [Trichonephila clavipes]|nr:hypothetical protein TNCV_4982451 [Trichonephila clavipes]